MGRIIILVTILSMAMGCQLEMPEGQFECENDDDCPEDWICDTDDLCDNPETTSSTEDTKE